MSTYGLLNLTFRICLPHLDHTGLIYLTSQFRLPRPKLSGTSPALESHICRQHLGCSISPWSRMTLFHGCCRRPAAFGPIRASVPPGWWRCRRSWWLISARVQSSRGLCRAASSETRKFETFAVCKRQAHLSDRTTHDTIYRIQWSTMSRLIPFFKK